MIRQLVFEQEYRCFPAGTAFEFRPGVNLLVGDNGTGKSSILVAILGLKKGRFQQPAAGVRIHGDQGQRFVYHDFEKDSPRGRGLFSDDIDPLLQVHMIMSSHGESSLLLLAALMRLEPGLLVLLDEPDCGLSVKAQRRLAVLLRALAARGVQVLAALHSAVVIGEFPEVLSVADRRWRPGAEFLEAQDR